MIPKMVPKVSEEDCSFFQKKGNVWKRTAKKSISWKPDEAFMLIVCALIFAAALSLFMCVMLCGCEMPQMWKKGEQIWTLYVSPTTHRKWDIGNRLFTPALQRKPTFNAKAHWFTSPCHILSLRRSSRRLSMSSRNSYYARHKQKLKVNWPD